MLSTENIIRKPIEVSTYDIDVAGHVNNIVYLRWFEDFRNLLFASLCPLEKLLEKRYYPVVISSNLIYRHQIKLFDSPLGEISFKKYSHGFVFIEFKIFIDNKLAFKGEQKCVLVNLINNKMFSGNLEELLNIYKIKEKND